MGIRITLDRELMPVFVKHPLPWTRFYWPTETQYTGIYDANDREVPVFNGIGSDSALWNIYRYVTAECSPDKLPHIFVQYRLPWRAQRWPGDGGLWAVLIPATGPYNKVYSGSCDKVYVLADLAKLAYDRYSCRRR